MFTYTFADSQRGHTLNDFLKIKDVLHRKYSLNSEIIDLIQASNVENFLLEGTGRPPEAYVLKVPGFLHCIAPEFTQHDVIDQLSQLPWDKKYYDTRRKKVLNKIARSNNVVADFTQEPCYEEGKGTVLAFSQAPLFLTELREEFTSWGESFNNLIAEGNYYHTPGKTGIGWHGDAERNKVVAVRMCSPEVTCDPIKFQWFMRSRGLGNIVEIPLEHGDLYVMSEKAVGSDWKRSSIYTLRHATGADKYVKPKLQWN